MRQVTTLQLVNYSVTPRIDRPTVLLRLTSDSEVINPVRLTHAHLKRAFALVNENVSDRVFFLFPNTCIGGSPGLCGRFYKFTSVPGSGWTTTKSLHRFLY